MRKLFLDTNIFLRFFLRDEEGQYQNVLKLLSVIEEGKFRPYTSSIVFLELNYVLRNIYKLSVSETVAHLEAMGKIRGMTVIEKTDSIRAINLYKKYRIKLGDCFIATQLSKGSILVTYDEDFGKVKEIESQNPEAILKELQPKRISADSA